MNDEQMRPILEVWLRDRQIPPPRAQAGVAKVMASVPRTRQQGRWWPLPVFYQRAQTPTATDTAEHQPDPIPATNGHTPTVIGRTHTMFSPAKAITAGALVFAIGGALLIAQPVQQPSSLPGVETETEPAVPVEFTGRWGYGPPLQGEQVAFEEGVGTYQGGAWRQTVSEVTDPRFDGDVVIFANHTTWPDGDVWNQAFRVQNDDGAWQSEPTYGVGFSELFESDAPLTSVFHGEGGYEGLTAIVELHWWDTGNGWDLWGVIFDGGLPPDPEPVPFE